MTWKGMSAAGWVWLSLLGLFLFTAGPILVALTAGLVAAALGCQLDEGNIHACPLLGIDLGGVLYFFGIDRKSTRLNSSHSAKSRMPSSA